MQVQRMVSGQLSRPPGRYRPIQVSLALEIGGLPVGTSDMIHVFEVF